MSEEVRSPLSPSAVPGAERVLGAIMFTDIEASVALQQKLGTDRYAGVLQRHGALFQEALVGVKTAHLEKHTGDGFMARFTTPSDAVTAALRFQWMLAREPWGTREPLRVRCAVHQGEILVLPASGQMPETVGAAVNLAARLLNLASGGQILLTRAVFDNARQFIREVPGLPTREQPLLGWEAHGAYLFKGVEEPVEVFEVGERGRAPFRAPENPAHAKRSVSAEEESTLGWRPARGMEVVGRPGWFLDERLGEGGFGEVWRAQNQRTREVRVFKFCFDAVRLRSLKRELLIFRLISEALGQRRDIVALYEAQLETAPFFLEGEFCPGGTLKDWFAKIMRAGDLPLTERIAVVAKIARTLAAAHSVGVIHKDIKPANIFIEEPSEGAVQPRLADFGIGVLTDTALIEQFGLTVSGAFTMTADASRTGTRMYGAPEYMLGKPASILGDIYSLGVLLYQMVAGDFDLPLGAGWQRDVPDKLLAEDIAACVDVHPERRLSSALQVAERLESLDVRRAAAEATARAEKNAREQQELLARQRRRLRLALLGAGVATALLAALTVTVFVLHRAGEEARLHAREMEAEREAARDLLYISDIQSAKEDMDKWRAEAARVVFERHRPRDGQRDRRGWEWYYGYTILNGSTLTQTISVQPLRALAVSPDERTVAVAGDDGEISMRSTLTLAAERSWAAGAPVRCLGWHRAGVLAAGLANGEVVVWDVASGREQRRWKAHSGAVTALEWHPAQTALLTGGHDGGLGWWRADGQPIREWRKAGPVMAIDWRDDGGDVAVVVGQPTRLLAGPVDELGTAHEVTLDMPESSVAWRPGYYEVAVAMNRCPLLLWNPQTASVINHAGPHYNAGSTAFAWNSLGLGSAVGCVDGEILVFDIEQSRRARSPLYGHTGRVTGLHWLERERQRLLSVAEDGTLRAWDRLRFSPELVPLPFPTQVTDAQWNPRDNRLAVLLAGDEVRVFEAETWSPVWTQPLPQPLRPGMKFTGGRLAWSPDGRWLAAVVPGRAPVFWRQEDGARFLAAGLEDASEVQWFGDNRRVLLRTAKGWSTFVVETGQYTPVFGLSADARVVALANEKLGVVRVDKKGLRYAEAMPGGGVGEETAFAPGFGTVSRVALNRERTQLAIAGESGGVVWLDVRTRRSLSPALGHAGPVQALGWHPDGTRLVTAGADATLRIFDTASAATVRTLPPELEAAYTAAGWSADGRRLLVASLPGKTVHIYDASAAYPQDHATPAPTARFAAACAALARRPDEDFAWENLAGEIRALRGAGANPDADLLLAAAELGVKGRFGPVEATAPPSGTVATIWQGVPLPAALQVAQACALQRWEEVSTLAVGESAWFAFARAEALARQGRAVAAETANLSAWRALRREQGSDDSTTPPAFLGKSHRRADLSSAANIALYDDWTGGEHNNLRSLPAALALPDGTRFTFDRFIQLAGKSFRLSREQMLPRSTPWLPFGRPASRLTCALASCYIDKPDDMLQDTRVGTLFFLRAGGSGAACVPLIYGRNVWDWWVPSGGQVTEAPPDCVIWQGENRKAANEGRALALYRLSWAARPGEGPVIALAVVSHLRRPAPMLLDVQVADE